MIRAAAIKAGVLSAAVRECEYQQTCHTEDIGCSQHDEGLRMHCTKKYITNRQKLPGRHPNVTPRRRTIEETMKTVEDNLQLAARDNNYDGFVHAFLSLFGFRWPLFPARALSDFKLNCRSRESAVLVS